MKRILITGGAGFIGSAVINKLQEQKSDIFVLDNLSFGNREFINIEREKFFEVDILDCEKVNAIINEINPHKIIHLAAVHFIPYCNQHPFESGNINIKGTLNVISAASSLRDLELFMFASTAAVYPVLDGPIKETSRLQPMDIYGLSKLAGEHLCNEFYLKSRIPTLICRFFNAFGPNETNPHLIPEIQRQLMDGKSVIKLGNLTPKRDFIHTYDMAEAIDILLNKFKSGIEIFNLGRGIEYSVKEVVDTFEKIFGKKIEITVESERIRKTERMHLLADITKLKDFTGWEPKIGIHEGIRTLLNK
ncbi:MAG TPA: NAD-dependent epimerase/dehydratase family protein [Chitinophagales bacterium]|nr:NAD-dependent epimerase/dehydratase family protein [Chitinophagales bacterium]